MKKSILAFLILFLIFLNGVYGQINIISPAEGKWSNKQMLVIDTEDKAEYFYSLNGDDPKTSGFAYDGPVLIDLTGDVTIRIQKATGKEEKVINYFVEQNRAEQEEYYSFINTFFDTGIINYTAGSTISIPYELNYAIGLGSENYIPGNDIYMSQDSVFARTLPCEIYDPNKKLKWRFVIKVFPQNYGSYSKYEVPFDIIDWDTISFNDKDLIFKLDDNYWELPKNSWKIDRSVPHTIYWQSISYEMGNPVEYFELPAKPQLTKQVNYDGSITLKLDGDNEYKMSILSQPENEYQELFYDLGLDTFYGDYISGNLKVGVFYNSVFQGELETDYVLNKRPPKPPVLASSNKGFYSRDDVTLKVSCKPEDVFYYSVSEPYLITDGNESYNPDSYIFSEVKMSDYKKSSEDAMLFEFKADGEGACYYCVKAYAMSGENKSQEVTYSVIIDKYNYYYCEAGNSDNNVVPDGTAERPYTSFEQCFSVINKGRYARLMIKGPMHIPSGKNVILSNCTFINQDDAELVFGKDSTIEVKSASLVLKDFTILQENSTSQDANTCLFKLENSVLDLFSCQTGANFSKNGKLIDSFNSAVNIKDSIISVSSTKYASVVSGVKSNIIVTDSLINTSSATSVIFSINQGNIKVRNNKFKVTGQIGRIFELFSVDGEILSNEFKSELTNKNSSVAIYTDKKCSLELKNNEDYGF